ncbi:MAG: hypothetical protein ABIB97_02665 [Patescibacteria group bacterium]
MSNKNQAKTLFNKNSQKLILAVIIIACLMIIIGILNLSIDWQSDNQNSNSQKVNSNPLALPTSDTVYSRYGRINRITNSQIEIAVSQSGKVTLYTTSVNEDTQFLSANAEAEDTEIGLADLQIGDMITVVSDSNIKNKTSFTANQIVLSISN